MSWTEEQLKRHLKEGALLPLYLLYGAESYLSAHYAGQIVRMAVGGDEMEQFNLHRFDGSAVSQDTIEAAAETLPLMADRCCVVVKDYDPAARSADPKRMAALFATPPESGVMVFRASLTAAEMRKTAGWKALLTAAESGGAAVEFSRKTPAEIVKILVSGAAKRGCMLPSGLARRMVEECGDDLNLLNGELVKLTALAGAGEITAAHFEAVGVRNLEAKVFDLSKAILARQYTRAYEILHRLAAAREEPVMILGVLVNAYADLYRVKTAVAAGQRPEAVGGVFPYRGREFALKNAARDAARLPAEVLRESLEVLARADRQMKSSRSDNRVVLEQTASRLILLIRGAF
ncbi:MAG: DNA polymerase III subunit delta [Oscillospiraceae bacterium]|nr:DNA polymerase III subunit delta [Oscillospiraceae bacterium]